MRTIALVFLLVPAARAAEPALQGGAYATVGSHDYWRLAGTFDAWWKGVELDPYLWGQAGGGANGSDIGLGGGAWRDLRPDTRVKGGLGFTVGRLKDAEKSTGSFLLETGVERDVQDTTFGGEFRFTTGGLPSARSTAGLAENQRRRGRRTAADIRESYSMPELIGYVSRLFGKVTAGFDLGLAFPSYGDTVVSETFRASVPVTEAVRARAALTFEQGDTDGVYVTLGASYRFQ